jgi:hypothetical protein
MIIYNPLNTQCVQTKLRINSTYDKQQYITLIRIRLFKYSDFKSEDKDQF